MSLEEKVDEINTPKPKKFRKFFFAFFIFATFGFYVFFIFIGEKNETSPAKSIPTTPKTHTLAFVRDGDIWVSSIDGSEQKKISTHSTVKYSWQHVMSPKTDVIDMTDKYNRSPKLSHDGRYLAFLTFTKESVLRLKQREKRIATESADTNTKGQSELFSDPSLEYELKIYSIYENKYLPTNELKNFVGCVNCFNSLAWARNKNVLVFINNFNLYSLAEKEKSGKKSFELQYTKNGFCGSNCHDIEDEVSMLSPSGDGDKLAATYNFYTVPANCNNTGGRLVMTADVSTFKFTLQKSDSTTCSVNVGPWYNDNLHFITNEYRLDASGFYKNSYNNLSSKKWLFEDDLYAAGISLSPDNRTVTYSIEKNIKTKKMRDLRIRDLKTKSYYDILDMINKQLSLNKTHIFFSKWDMNSRNIYFIAMEGIGNKKGSVVRFDTLNKKSHIVVDNAAQLDIN